MGARGKLRTLADGFAFFCPGCHEHHTIPAGRWSFNGNFDRPTFTPSVLIRTGCKAPHAKPGEDCWCTLNAAAEAEGEPPSGFKCSVCHLHVTDGRLAYCADCTHELAGKTVPMEDADK